MDLNRRGKNFDVFPLVASIPIGVLSKCVVLAWHDTHVNQFTDQWIALTVGSFATALRLHQRRYLRRYLRQQTEPFIPSASQLASCYGIPASELTIYFSVSPTILYPGRSRWSSVLGSSGKLPLSLPLSLSPRPSRADIAYPAMLARPASLPLRCRCLLRSSQPPRAFSTQSPLRSAGSHGDHYDPPTGWLWGVKPGHKYVKEGWEGLWTYGFMGSLVVAGIAYAFKPDTSYVPFPLPVKLRFSCRIPLWGFVLPFLPLLPLLSQVISVLVVETTNFDC